MPSSEFSVSFVEAVRRSHRAPTRTACVKATHCSMHSPVPRDVRTRHLCADSLLRSHTLIKFSCT
eukprot:4628742-Pleurochrysis_carterae.AAC.2